MVVVMLKFRTILQGNGKIIQNYHEYEKHFLKKKKMKKKKRLIYIRNQYPMKLGPTKSVELYPNPDRHSPRRSPQVAQRRKKLNKT